MRRSSYYESQKGNEMNKQFDFVMKSALTGVLMALLATGDFARAQGQPQDQSHRASDVTSDASDSTVPATTASTSQPDTDEAPPSKVESSIFVSLLMAGKTQDKFKPLTSKERPG